MAFLKFIRYQNLLLLAFMQLLFHFAFFKPQYVPVALNDWQFMLLVLATVCIAAGGYIINNILDVETDLENQKRVIVGFGISESSAYYLYMAFTVAGVAIGYYLSQAVGKPGFLSAFILVAMLLYVYSTNLKQLPLIGNLVIAFLLAASVLIVGVFDLLPIIVPDNKSFIATIFQILFDFAIFAFLINLLREMVKDLEDVNGDYRQGMNTLPIALGVSRTTQIVFYFSFIPILLLLWYLYEYMMGLIWVCIYALIFIVAPLIFFTIRIQSAEKPRDYKRLSLWLKFVLLFGMLSIALITLNMKWNAV